MCSFLLPRSAGITAHTRTHMHRPWLSRKEELDARLLLSLGFLTIESSTDGVIGHDTAAAAAVSSQQQRKM